MSMQLLKIFISLLFVTMSLSKGVAQYVQPMRYDHYSFTQQANIGVGTVRTTAASAYLEVGPTSGANKGFLPPRLSTTLRDAISSPADGLFIYNTTTKRYNFYNGSAWSDINTSSGVDSIWRILGVDSIFFLKNGNTYKIKDSTGGSPNSNIGSGYRLAVPGTNNVKTLFVGYGIIKDSTSNANGITTKLDTTTVFPAIRATIQSNVEPGNLKLYSTTGGTYWYTVNSGSYTLDSLFYKIQNSSINLDSFQFKPQIIPYPDGWTYKPVTIQRDNDGTISNTMTTDEFRHRYKLYGKTYYVDNAGSDSNDGLTPAAPLLTIGAALAKSDVVEISCDSGYYYQNSWAYYDTITKSVSIYCPNGKAIFGDAFKPTGFLYLTSDSADVWRAEAVTGGKVYGIDTVDVFGNPIIYTKVSSKAACNALERSYYSPQFGQPGYPNTYFNPPSSIGTPVQLDNIYVTAGNSGRYLLDSYGTSRDSLTLYLEGIEFIGAGEISRMTDGCKIYAQDCRFVGSTNSTDAFRTDYGEEVVLYNCNGGYSELDVFSYTATDKVAEISVNGIWAGIYGGVSNQVSTAHSATNIVRVNGDYRNSTTYILTDVNTNTKSFNVGIKTKGADSTNSIPYYTLDNANMYLVDCIDSSSTPDFTLAAGSGATIFIQNFKSDATNYSTTPQSNPLGYIKYYGFSRNDSAGYFVEKINRVIKPIGTDSLFQYIDGLKYFIGLDETAAPAGTGITELNGLNATTQTFSSNTIDIISSGSNHAFELKYDTTAIVTFGAGSGADSDTTAFTTSAIYGSFYNDADTIVVTSFKAVLQGTSPDVTYKIWYNDSLNVEAGATALNTAGNQVTNTTTGTNVTSFDVTKIPPGVWVWVKTSTVATKPKYFSLTINGYRK